MKYSFICGNVTFYFVTFSLWFKRQLITIAPNYQFVYLWRIYYKEIYFKMVWYLNQFCKNATIWYTCFSWCSLMFKNHHNFAKLFFKAHFVVQCFSWSQLFSKINLNTFFNHISDTNFENQLLLKLNKGFVQGTEGRSTSVDTTNLTWQHMSVDALNIVHSCAPCIWFSYFVLQ